MEAKSFKTLSSMKSRRDDYLFLWNCIKAGLIVCVVSGMFFALYRMDDQYLQFILPLNMFVCSAIIYGFFTLQSHRQQTVMVIRQLAQYPANEKWLAFSKDSWNALSNDKCYDLEEICISRGIGIVIASGKGKTTAWQSANMHWKQFGDFLSYYNHEKRIRRVIE